MDLGQIRHKIDKLLIERDFATKQVVLEKILLESALEKINNVTTAQEVLQLVAETIQVQANKQIASIVTRCLKMVFGHNHEFRFEFKRARGKTEAKMVFLKDGEEFDPKEESGGGVIDVAAFGLRLSCLMLSRPRLRRLIVADEPFKWINGSEYQEKVAQLIQLLSEEMNIQFIIVSDDDWLHVGHVVNLE